MKTRKLFSVILAALMLLSVFPLTAGAYSKEQATLTFTSDGITETVSGSGYTIDGTSLTITSDGTYRIKGSCAEGKIEVSKSLSNVTLILDNLTLSNSDTAPIIVKKSSSVLMKLVGTSTITNNEEASKETTDPDNFEGAAIKVKSGSSLTIFGDGILNVVGNAKNAIKGGAESSLKVDGGTIKATAVNNGIGFDGSIVINAGTFDVTSGNDGIKSQPDEGDTASAGTVTINGGAFNINAQGDGIVAAEKLTINNGDFTIKTLSGYNSSSFNKDTMSCKGLKASSNNVADADNPTMSINISGGNFNLNTADDAVHSDGYVTITGGTFNIFTGDDGVHADATLTLGTENGYERDPEITVNSSYEGLEGAVVNIYSGRYYVIASDDGINAAGGSSNGSDPAQGGNDTFRPGQGGQGQGGQGQGGPGQGGFNPGGQTSTGNYSINVYGGSVYVNCMGDGLDSNGALNLLGGDLTVLSMQSGGDNSPLDADGTVTINGATIFAAGSRGMDVNLSSSSQKAYTNTSSYSANTVVNVTSSGTVLRSEKLVRNINYLLYSQPNLGTCSVSTGSSVNTSKSNAFAHNWDNGTIVKASTATEAGLIKYTCSDCEKVEYKTIPALNSVTEYKEEEASTSATTATEATSETQSDKGYAVNFTTDGNATINVYHTQDYSKVSETNVSSAVSRDSSSGAPDSSGNGQVNFTVVPADGYEVESVTVTPTSNYKNLKDQSATLANTYRITKITGELNVVVTTKAKTTEDTSTTEATEATEATESSQTAETTQATEDTQETQTTEATENTTAATEPAESTSAPTSAETSEPTSSTESTQSTLPAQTKIKLTAAKKTIYVNASTTVKAAVTNPLGKTTFKSSNTKVATVSSTGKVIGKKAGTVTITAKNNGKVASVKIKIVKRANKMTVKGRTVTAKAKKNSAFKASKVLTVKNAKGSVVYKKMSGNAKISINAKTGKLTVKKGLKKGSTYKIKVKVTAKGNTAYKDKSKTVTIKVKVK